jgi:ethanolamine utilization protein EutA
MAFQKYGLEQGENIVALSFRQVHLDSSNYDLMKTFARGITKALKKTIEMKTPIILVFGTDIGRTIGNMVIGLANKDIDRGVIDCDVISIDEVDLKDLDFIDIGGKMEGGEFVPVVVKSLIFNKR